MLRRRKGFSPLAASLGATNVRMLDWCRIDGTDHLLTVENGDVRDWLHATPGTLVPNGVDRLPAAADANSAWIEEMLVIGNGTDANVRYKPTGGGDGDLAADLNGTDEYFQNVSSTDLDTGDVDFTIAGWVWLDSLAANQVLASKYDAVTSSQREWRLYYKQSTNKFVFGAWQFASTAGAEAEADNGSALVAGQWYYVVGWHDAAGNVVGCQVNNATAVTTGYALGITANSVDFRLGAQVSTPLYLDGRLQRWGFWKSAASGGGVLAAGTKTSLYNSGSGKAYASLTAGEKTALIAYWDLTAASGDDGHSASATNDLTGVNSPGTADGGVSFERAIARLMTSTPTASSGMTAVNSTGGGSAIPAGTYRYKVSFLNADGVPSPAGSSYLEVDHALTHETSVQTIPVCPAGEDCSGRRLWRLDPGAEFYAFLADISDNTTTIYVDNTPSVVGNETLVEENETTPPLQVFCEHNSRIVGANGSDGTLCVTNKFEPYYCPSAPDIEDVLQGTQTTLQGRAAGAIRGVGSHGAYCAVFTAAAGYFLTGDAPLDFAVNKFCDHGCVAHRTIRSARDWLIWLGPDGVYAWINGTTVNISGDRQDTIDAMTAAEMAGAHAFVWEDKYFLCWATGCIVFDLVHRIWTTNTNWLWRDCAVSEFTGSAREKLYGALEGATHIFQLETGATDNGTTIPAVWASKDWDMGLAGRRKRCHYLEARTKKGTGTLIATLKVGTGQTVQTEAHDISTVEEANETVSRLFESCNEMALSEFFRFEVSCATSASEFELQAVGLHWLPAQ